MTPSVLHTSYHVRSPLTPSSGSGFSFTQFISKMKRLFLGRRIDSNQTPSVREGVFVEKHVGLGIIFWDKHKHSRSVLVLKEQFSGKGITGKDFLKEIMLTSMMNATVLDWLLANPHEIPRQVWQGKKIFFWGTLYSGTNNNLYVRYLDCSGTHVSESFFCLNSKLTIDMCALLFC